MFVYTFMYIYICTYVLGIYIYIHNTYICTYIYACIHVYIQSCLYVHIHTYVFYSEVGNNLGPIRCLYICLCIYIYVYICMYIFVLGLHIQNRYICTYIGIHIYIYGMGLDGMGWYGIVPSGSIEAVGRP